MPKPTLRGRIVFIDTWQLRLKKRWRTWWPILKKSVLRGKKAFIVGREIYGQMEHKMAKPNFSVAPLPAQQPVPLEVLYIAAKYSAEMKQLCKKNKKICNTTEPSKII